MIPRKPPRVRGNIFPRPQVNKFQRDTLSCELSAENSKGIENSVKNGQHRLKQGEGDPKLAGAILELAQGPHSL